jgi:hypothetical protein
LVEAGYHLFAMLENRAIVSGAGMVESGMKETMLCDLTCLACKMGLAGSFIEVMVAIAITSVLYLLFGGDADGGLFDGDGDGGGD